MSEAGGEVEALSADKISKIQSDLDIVRNNMTVFSEMLTELNPSGGGNPADLELLQELYKSCKEMQSRVGQLLCTPTTDELTVDMLQINDDMNDLFDRYDRKTAAYKSSMKVAGGGGGGGGGDLIDLGEEVEGGRGGTKAPSLVQNISAMNIQPSTKPSNKKEDTDFDQFVSSRSTTTGTTNTTTKEGSSMRPQTEEEIIHGHRETDFQEMEDWLKANPGTEASLTSMPSLNPGLWSPSSNASPAATDKSKPS